MLSKNKPHLEHSCHLDAVQVKELLGTLSCLRILYLSKTDPLELPDSIWHLKYFKAFVSFLYKHIRNPSRHRSKISTSP